MRLAQRAAVLAPLAVLVSIVAAAPALSGGSSAGAGADTPSMLFTQDAGGGTFVPVPGRRGQYWLTLNDAKPRTLWFEDRPGDLKGTVPNERMLDMFFSGTSNGGPPNAAVDAWDPRHSDDVVMGVKLLSGTWDAKARRLRYRVSRLEDRTRPPGSKLPASSTKIDSVLPRRFENAALFIDDEPCTAQCSAITDLVKLGQMAYTFFTSYNTCAGGIFNNTDKPLRWVDDDSKKEDRWVVNPPRTIGARKPNTEPPFPGWMTTSAWARGCWNNVIYTSDYGTVQIAVEDLYSGGNSWWCKATGELECWGPEYGQPRTCTVQCWTSERGGAHLRIGYCVVRRGRDPAPCNRDVDER
jgi:hypothetical protein